MDYKFYPETVCHKCTERIGGAGQPGAYSYGEYSFCQNCLYRKDHDWASKVRSAEMTNETWKKKQRMV